MFINNNIAKFDLYLRSYDFEQAAGSINLLKKLIDRKKIEELQERIETAKNIYITRLIMKASEHFDMGEYSLSWKYFSAVYKLNNETTIKEKLNEIRGKYPVKKQDKIYTQKIYLLSAYNFATDESYVIDIKELFKYDMSFNVDDLKFSIKELKRTMPNELKINLN